MVESTLTPQELFAHDTAPAEEVDVRILEAALEQFVLVGIRRTSADDIARRARVNRTTLYRRMGTKDQIVRAAVLHEVRRLIGVIGAEIAAITPGGPPDLAAADALRAFARGYIQPLIGAPATGEG